MALDRNCTRVDSASVSKYLSENLGGLAFLSAFGRNPRSAQGKAAESTQKSGSNHFRIGSNLTCVYNIDKV